MVDDHVDPQPLKDTLARAIENVARGLNELLVVLLHHVSVTAAHMSTLAHQRLDGLAPRVSGVEAAQRQQTSQLADHEERLLALEQQREVSR